MGFEVKLLLSENDKLNSKTKRNRGRSTKRRLPALSVDGQLSPRRSVDPYL